MIIELLKIVAATWLIIFIHELGHIVTYKRFKDRWPKMRFVKGCFEVEGNGLGRREARWFVLGGVLSGFGVIIALIDVFQPYIIVALIISYLWGCRNDFKELERLRA